MKKLSILLLCSLAIHVSAMDYKVELLMRMKSHAQRIDRNTVATALLGGGVVVSRIFAQACDGQEYCFVARTIPLVPGLTMVAYNMLRDYRDN